MYIKYKPTITDQLVAAKQEAMILDREIEYIELDTAEWDKLRRETSDLSSYAHLCFYNEIEISGVLVKKEKNYALAS